MRTELWVKPLHGDWKWFLLSVHPNREEAEQAARAYRKTDKRITVSYMTREEPQ